MALLPRTRHVDDFELIEKVAAAARAFAVKPYPPEFIPPPDKRVTMKVFREDVVEALRTVHDPEIPINVYDLGLIYEVDVAESNDVAVRMTLTTPNCPEAQSIPRRAAEAIREHVPGVGEVSVAIVWEPKWTKAMMSEDAKLALGMF